MANTVRKVLDYLTFSPAEEEYDDYSPQWESPSDERSLEPVRDAWEVEDYGHEGPAQQSRSAEVTNLYPQHAPVEMARIVTLRPTSFKDTVVIADNYCEGIPVILDLTSLDDGAAQRTIDFVTGLRVALKGDLERVASKVFLLSPSHVRIDKLEQESEDFVR